MQRSLIDFLQRPQLGPLPRPARAATSLTEETPVPRIHIDTSALTYPWFWLPEHLPRFVDGSVPGGVQLDLAAGEYAVQQTRERASDLASG